MDSRTHKAIDHLERARDFLPEDLNLEKASINKLIKQIKALELAREHGEWPPPMTKS